MTTQEPFALAPFSRAHSLALVKIPPAPKRILVVDDLPSLRESLQRLFTQQGYDVAVASNGREAMQLITQHSFDIVLLDLTMPELNGWNALKLMQAVRPGLPVIVMTAHPHQREWVEPSGARALFEKPIEIELLLATVRRLVNPPDETPQDRFTHVAPCPSEYGTHARSGINE